MKFQPVMLLLALFFILHGCAYVNVPLLTRNLPLEEQVLEGEGKGKILLLDIAGFISEKDKSGGLMSKESPSMIAQVREALQKAEQDKNIRGLILRVNSPGGTVTASDVIYHDLMAFKGRKKIPVIACIMSIGASGAYYISTAADEIVAHPTSITGSIGVIVMKFNVEGLMGKIGVTEKSIKSGDKKDILSPFRPATTEEQKLMQDIIDELHGRFVQVVLDRNGNKLLPEQIKLLADGRIYTAEQARTRGLVDRVGYLDDAIEEMKKKVGMEKMKVVTYFRPGTYKGSIYSEGPDSVSIFGSLAGMLGGDALIGESGFMYLWRP